MRKLFSVLMAVIMIFSCCTIAVNALYRETIVETKYVDNLRDYEVTKSYSDIKYSDIIIDDQTAAQWLANPANAGKPKYWLYTASEYKKLYPGNLIGEPDLDEGETYIEYLRGNDFIEAVAGITTDSETTTSELPLYDAYGRPTGNDREYTYTNTTTQQFEILGFPVDYLYNNNSGALFWENLTAHPENYQAVDENGKPVILTDITKADISLMFGDINMFLLRILKTLYSDYRFYTEENAIKCINLIGKMFFSDFAPYSSNPDNGNYITVFSHRDFVYADENGVNYADEDVFFQKVADISGFSDLIQINWVDYGPAMSNYKPLLELLGVSEGSLVESEFYRGDKIAPAILYSAFVKIMGEGPIAYFLNVFETLAKGYRATYYVPIKLLFSQKEHLITQEELKTLTGLLNLIFNDNDPSDRNSYQFAPLPESRLASVDDKSEFYITMLAYINLNSHYLGNRKLIFSNLFTNIKNSAISDEATVDENNKVTAGYQTRLINIISSICGDDLEEIFYNGTISDLTVENIANKPTEYIGNVKEAIARIIKQIADWFQMWLDILTGNLEFGAGAFD